MTPLSRIIDHESMIKITSEFTRLKDRCYLENAGAALYPKCLLESIHRDLLSNIYLNPHSDKYTSDCIEQIRCLVLQHFNTDPSTYSVVFTSGTTQALKLVLESFNFQSEDGDVPNYGAFMYLRDSHTSVIGLRELAQDKNADVVHISHEDFLKYVSPMSPMPSNWRKSRKNEGNTLLTYPAQSNFNGYKYSLDCIENIKGGCLNSYAKKHLCKVNCNWFVLLDAAAYAATNKLDLSQTQPDFVCLSFYKIFGYPTGLGALLIKNSSAHVLSQKKYFGGGAVDIVLSSEDFHVKRNNIYERFEDGTIPFLSIISLKHCFDTLNMLIPKVINTDLMESIGVHSFYLAKDLYQQLLNLEHKNGRKAAILYMDSDFTNINLQGGIVAFGLIRDDGSHVGYAEFQHMADLFNISVRTGCFCNSGSCQRHLSISNTEMKEMYKAGHKCGDDVDLVNNKPTGVIRASFGYYNTYRDVDKLMNMIYKCFVKSKYKKPHRIEHHFRESRNKTNGEVKQTGNFYKEIHIIPESQSSSDSKIVLKEISVFPVKSCGAFKVTSMWEIGPKGFAFDREWMIVKDNGTCLTQKNNSRMCMIKPKIDLKQGCLVLNFKGKSPIKVSLDVCHNQRNRSTTFCQSKICTDIVNGYDCGDEVADWISEALEVSFLRLVRQASDDRRAKKKGQSDQSLLSLSNQAQYLLINKATVRWLSSKIQDPLFADSINKLTDRFRGNMVIDMDEELAEREWQHVIIGKHKFKVEGLCPRCQMVCIDQQTGKKTVEPLRTIAEQFAGKMRFGIYLSYVGTIDGSSDKMLKIFSDVHTTSLSDDELSSNCS